MEKKYNEYDALDFAQDDSFTRWVRQKGKGGNSFWKDWLNKHPEKAGEVEVAKKMISALKVKESVPTDVEINNLWTKIDSQIDVAASQPRNAKIRTLRPWMAYVAAAAIAAIFFIKFSFGETYLNIAAPSPMAVYLPDNSLIELNAGSEISYAEDDWGQKRKVKLNGEAFFQVEKGSNFLVETPYGKVEVLGTSFNVRAENGNLTVDCFTGKVRVTATDEQQQKVLTAEKGTIWNADSKELESYEFEINKVQKNWREGIEFHYDKTPLALVFKELERQYGTKIEATPSILKETYTGFFAKNNLEEALYNVTWPMKLEYEVKGNIVLIKKIKE